MPRSSRFSDSAAAFHKRVFRASEHIRAALIIFSKATLPCAPMKQAQRLGVVMDPIADIKYAKDSTLAILLAAQARGFALSYMEQADLSLRDGKAFARL